MALTQQRLDEIRRKAEEDALVEHPRRLNTPKEILRADENDVLFEHEQNKMREGYAAAAYRYMVEAEERERWIPVEERMPENGEEVDVWYRGERCPRYRFIRDHGGKAGNNFFDPVVGGIVCIRPIYDVSDEYGATHWKPLPSPPDQPGQ